jgi:hypothetical protein
LPFTHVYGSHNHSREQGWDDVDTGDPGEVWGSDRPYYKGAAPILCGEPGIKGDANAWLGLTDRNSPRYITGIGEGVNAVAAGYAGVTHTGNPPAGIGSVLSAYGHASSSVAHVGGSPLVEVSTARNVVPFSAIGQGDTFGHATEGAMDAPRAFSEADNNDEPIGLAQGDEYTEAGEGPLPSPPAVTEADNDDVPIGLAQGDAVSEAADAS